MKYEVAEEAREEVDDLGLSPLSPEHVLELGDKVVVYSPGDCPSRFNNRF